MMEKEQWLSWLSSVAPNRYVQAVVIVLICVVVAKITDLIIQKVVRKWAHRSAFVLDDQLVDIFHQPIFTSILLFGLGLASERLAFPPMIDFVTAGVLQTMGILIWSLAIMKFARLLLGILSDDEGRFHLIQDRTLPLFTNLIMILVISVSFYVLFLVWNIDLTAWMASAGIIGLAISFAAKDTLANLFSGVFIMADAPYKLGDMIVLESGERGMVTSIGIRSSRILTRDDVEITIPNAIMGNTKVINEAGGRHEKYRIRVQVGVSYGSDIDRVHAVLLEEALRHGEVCDLPEPRVRFRSFGDSSLDHELLCWIENPVLRGRLLHELNTAIYKRFLKEGIEIPFPQRDLHIVSGSPTAL